MKNLKWLLLIGGTILILCLIIGGKAYVNKQKEAEELSEDMISFVKSDEAKKIFEDGLKDLDPKALTSEGVIQSYEIDYESIEHNPMGGINGSIYVNNDNKLVVLFNLDKIDEINFDKSVISATSYELGQKLKGGN